MRKSIFLLMIAGILSAAPNIQAGSFDPVDGAFIDDFEISANFLINGVEGTGWDGFSLGTQGTVEAIEAADGVLTITSTNSALNQTQRSPFLYKELDCDFDMSVDIVSATVQSFNNLALMVRVKDVNAADGDGPAGAEDFLFLRWSPWQNNRVGYRTVDNGGISAGGQTFYNEVPTAFRIERVGDNFSLYSKHPSGPGPNDWDFHETLSLPDFSGEVLQVGITQACYGNNQYSGVYDNFRLKGPLVRATGNLSLFEGDDSLKAMTVELLTQPADDVQITISAVSDDPNAANGTDLFFNALEPNEPIVLTFTPSDWAAKTVNVFAVDDGMNEGKEDLTIAAEIVTSDPNFPPCMYNFVTISIFDGASYVVSKSDLTVQEGGTSDSFDVSLFTEPSEAVTVTVADLVSVPDQVTISPSVLNFDDTDFGTPKTVTVTAIDDVWLENDPHTIQIQLTAAGGNYDGLVLEPSDLIDVSILENECGAWDFLELDLNRNCTVEIGDYVLWLQSWLNCTIPYATGCFDARQQ